MRRLVPILALLLLVPGAAGEDPQRPREPGKDARGLLKVNREYYGLAAATGGDFYFWAPGEFAARAPFDVPDSGDAVVLAYGSLGAETVIEVPVEAGVRSLSLFVGIQRMDLVVLVRPDGTPARDGDPGVAIQSFQHMRIAAIESPAAGTWKIELTGAGLYSISVRVRPGHDAPSLDGFEFVEQRGRPGHEGLFPLERTPVAGESLDARASLSGSVARAEFSFVAPDGTVLGACVMKRDGGEWLGRCAVPSSAFRVVVTGEDRGGRRFRRVEVGLVEPQ